MFSIKRILLTIQSDFSWSSLLSFLHFRRKQFTTDGAVTRIEFQLPHLKNFKLKQRSASFGIQRNFQLNKDSQTEFFSQPRVVVSVLSLIQKNLRPVQICILCAVREELTYICKVCLTKSLSSKVFLLEMKVYPLFQAGKVSITC